MIPLPANPKIVILLNEQGTIINVASNVSPLPNLEVQVLTLKAAFDIESLGMPFNQETNFEIA